MNKKERNNLYSRYREAITQRLWEQWICLGVEGFSPSEREPEWVIDPEALILASSRMFAFEPRLRESVLSWILQNSDFVSIARLKRIQKDHSIGDVGSMAEAARDILDTNPALLSWNSISKWEKTSRVRESAPEIRELTTPFPPAKLSCTILKLRGIFGVTSRVEILFWLYHHARSSVSTLARETAWSVQTVQKTLKEMERSGHVFSEKEGWPSTQFFLRSNDWKAFFPQSGYDTFDEIHLGQFDLYTGVFRMMEALEKAANSKDDSYARFILKEGLTDSFQPHQRARNSLVAAYESPDKGDTVSASVERLISNAESSDQWPVGAFSYRPETMRLE